MSAPGLPNPLPPDEDRSSVLNGVAIGLLVPAILMVILRTGVRVLMVKNMGWDDWLMIIATPLLIADEVISIISTQHGVGRHIFYLSPADATMALELNTIAQPLNILGLFFVKASIVALLIRLKLKNIFKIILYITLGLLMAITIVGIVIAFAQCQPFEKNWIIDLPGFCWSRDAFQDAAYILQGITILTDLCYITIPFFFLWNVHIPRGTKIGILSVIGLGVISMACSVAAVPFVQELEASIDVTWTIVDLAAIKIGEANVAMIVGCIPPLQPLFKMVNHRYFSRKMQTADTYEARLARLKVKPSEYEMLSGKTGGNSSAASRGFHSHSDKPSFSPNTISGIDNDMDLLREHGMGPSGQGYNV